MARASRLSIEATRLSGTRGLPAGDLPGTRRRQPKNEKAPEGQTSPSTTTTRGPLPSDMKNVTCWCERKVVRVHLDDIVAGRTGSCGRAECHPPTKEE